MASFIVTIKVSNIDPQTMAKLRPEEGKVLLEWKAKGILTNAFVRKDLTGAFLVMKGGSKEEVNQLIASLPMYKYMTFETIELEESTF